MPNGHDKNWVRLCITLAGFRARYGRWPSRVRLPRACLADLRDDLLTKEDFAKITERLTLVPDERALVAEDDQGASFTYGETFSRPNRAASAREWLDVQPRAHESDRP
ncbi:MAG: hypothetical protein JO069_20745 [Verrucomicrobia bacterium]|nr:hypothetical protein [Verrucomicrobiota bacterium]